MGQVDHPVIDSVVFHDWPGVPALSPYLSPGYRAALERPEDVMGPLNPRDPWLYDDPREPKASARDRGALTRWVDDSSVDRVVLGYHDAILATAFQGQYAARAVVSAANDWVIHEQLPADPRLYGLMLISSSLPDQAAAEIRRVGASEKIVGVALGCNALGRPFGDPLYHPIYAEAAKLDLPLVLQVGSDAAASLDSPPVAGGLPSTFSETHALGAQSHMSHIASLILGSVFDQFPSLQVLVIGGGLTWIPGFLWRLDYWYKMSSADTPWMTDLPSAYFARHFKLATYDMETSVPADRLLRVLEAIPGDVESMLVYGSGYPSPDTAASTDLVDFLPPSWSKEVLHANASGLFRWPDRATQTRGAAPALEPSVLLTLPEYTGRSHLDANEEGAGRP